MTWKRIRLELARSTEYPEGSRRHGYEFLLPLDPAGRIDRPVFRKAPELCTVHRFWDGEGDAVGTILHARGNRWLFSYALGESDDEPIPRLSDHQFREGNYLAVREPKGEEHTFRIVRVEPAPGLATPRSA